MSAKYAAAFAAFCESEGLDASEFEQEGPSLYGEGVTFEGVREEYAVLTDHEADAAWDAALDSYLEECVLPQLDGTLSYYFDTEKWKRDARFDGRAHALSSYDGSEYEEEIDGEWFYIYRVN